MKRTSSETHVYIRRHQGAKVDNLDVSNMIDYKFLHGGVSYTPNGGKVNVMLEFVLKVFLCEYASEKSSTLLIDIDV